MQVKRRVPNEHVNGLGLQLTFGQLKMNNDYCLMYN